MKEFTFGTFGPEHLKKIQKGVHAFNNEQFWECHELLEDIWLEDRNDPARMIYWAIIQVANTLYHHRNDNLEGATGQLFKAKNKFERCHEQKSLTNLTEKFLNWSKLESEVYKINLETAVLKDFLPLSKFKFDNYPY